MVKPRPIDEKGPMRRFARALNQVSSFAESMRILRGRHYNVRNTTQGQLLALDIQRADDATHGVLQRMYVDFVANDYLQCRKSNSAGEPIGTTTYDVAKPPALRVATYHNVTTTIAGVLATFSYDDSNSRRLRTTTDFRYWDESLWPPYVVEDNEIYAMQPVGKTGLTVNFETGNKQLEWIDMNVSARQFRPLMTEVPICQLVGGIAVTRYILVAGGPVQE